MEPEQNGLHAETLAQVAGHGRCDRLAGRPLHQLQCGAHLRCRQHFHIRRLLQLDFERVLQSAVEHSLARGIGEVGEQQRPARRAADPPDPDTRCRFRIRRRRTASAAG